MAFRLIRFGTKVGIAYGLVYYTAQEGIWRGSDESTKVYKKLCEAVVPYVNSSPVKIPELPKTDHVWFLAQHYWNRGVIATFAFLASVPGRAVEWSKLGYDMAREQLQQKQVNPGDQPKQITEKQ